LEKAHSLDPPVEQFEHHPCVVGETLVLRVGTILG
jgi:hypothetical protein